MNEKFFERWGATIVATLLFLIYILGISNLSTIDGWGYAADIVNSSNLLRPHHLLYTITGFYWVKIWHVFLPNAETIYLLKLMNTLCASVSAFILFKLLRLVKVDAIQATIYTIIAGLSWGFLRFSIENETYTIPVMLAIWASYLFLKAENSAKTSNMVYSGLLSASACLYHQIMFFWWIALAIGTIRKLNSRDYKPLLFLAPAAIVPAAYILAMLSMGIEINFTSFFRFIFSDYYTGNASIELNSTILMVGIINLFRTFFQMHGYINYLLAHSWLWWIPLVVSGIAFAFFSFWFVRYTKPTRLEKFHKIHLLALVLQVGFAFMAGGNAEFMAMVPFLTIITATGLTIKRNATVWFAISVSVWNISFGVLPQKIYQADGSELVIKSITQNTNERRAYILTDAPKVINRLEYLQIQKPLIVKEVSIEPQKLYVTLDSLQLKGYTIYTDCINQPRVTSRATLITDVSLEWDNLEGYKTTTIDSLEMLGGKVYLTKISR